MSDKITNNQKDKAQMWLRFRNSFLTPKFLFPLIIRDQDFTDVLNGTNNRNARFLFNRALEKLLWFWPRITESRIWAVGNHYSPDQYRDFDEGAKLLVDTVDAYAVDQGASILDLGCNIGRHLQALHARGYTNLIGVDAMGEALDCFKKEYPEIVSDCELHHDLFQRFLSNRPSRSIDIIFTRGATIELVHPSFDVVGHICRITSNYVILFIQEQNQGYPRLYIQEFSLKGFVLVNALRPISQPTAIKNDQSGQSLLVFRRGETSRA